VFLADTRGLHRGLNLQRGHRLVFQMEYACSLFGAPVSRALLPAPPRELSEAMHSFPAAYRRLTPAP
jgi:hypothetical protein